MTSCTPHPGPTFTGELYPHQTVGLEFLASQSRCVLADDVGLGKTAQAASLIGWLADTGQLRRTDRLPVLWVTTAGLVQQTVAELRRFLPSLVVIAAEDVKTKAERDRAVAFARQHPAGPDVVVMHHDQAHRRYTGLRALDPSLVVVDEASALKGAAVRHDSLRDVCSEALRSVIMTATPMENSPVELHAILALACIPDLPTRETFERDYCTMATFGDGRRVCTGWASPEAAQYVMGRIAGRFLRRRAADVGLELPTKVESGHVFVPLTATQAADYAKVWGKGLGAFARKQAAARRGSDGSSDLIPTACQYVAAEVAAGSKVVVYVEHLKSLSEVAENLGQLGLRCESLQGANELEERTEAVTAFRDDPAVSVLIGTKVLEHGLNLQFANTLVSVGQTYNPGREAQREGRLCRIGSPNKTYKHVVFLPDAPIIQDQIAKLAHKTRQAAPVLN